MVKTPKKSTKRKWLFSIVVTFIILFILSFFVLGPIIKNKLVEQVAIQTDSTYFLTIEKLGLNIFMGDVSIHKINFIPNPSKKRGSENNDMYIIKAPRIDIQGINFWKLVFNNEVTIRQLDLVAPQVQWKRHVENVESEDTVIEADRGEGQQKQFPPVRIERINLTKLNLEVMQKTDSTSLISLDNASLRIDDFTYNDSNNESVADQFGFNELTFLLKDYEMKLPDSLYALRFDSLKASFRTSSVLINGLELIPLYNNADFMKKKGEQTDRMNLYNKALYIAGIDFKRLKEKEEFSASFVSIDSLNLLAYRDKRYILPDDKFVKLPQQSLREAPFYINIDSLSLQNAQITYRERVEDASEPGTINFVDLKAKIYNITNDSALLKSNIAMEADASAYLMGSGRIDASFYIPIADPNNVHFFTGSLSPMNMRIVNPMLKHIVFGEIISGQVNEFNFNARANETASHGTMRFGYEDLKVQINNKDSEKGKKGMITFLANTFIVKSANPSNKKFRESEMYYERDKRKSIINFWWKTLLSGIKETLGVPKNEEEKAPE